MMTNTNEALEAQQTAVSAAIGEGVAAYDPAEAPPLQPGRKTGVRRGMRGIRRRLGDLAPALRFPDPAQRRAGVNILRFVAGLLALTLIARGTSGATLARVELTNPSRSEIVEAVTGSATVSARDSLGVFAPEGLTIAEMPAGAGQRLNTGDAVAVFDVDEVAARLARENAELDKLLLELERLSRTDNADATPLETAQKNLRRAREDHNAAKTQGEADINAARDLLQEIMDKQVDDPDTAALDNARRALDRAKEDYSATKAQGEADIASAQATLDEALKKRADPVDTTAADTAWRNLTRAQQDYNTIRTQGEAEINAARAALKAAEDESAGDEAIAALKTALANAEAKHNENMLSASRRVEDAQAAYYKAEQDSYNTSVNADSVRQTGIDNAKNTLESAKKKAAENLAAAARRVEDAEISFSLSERDYGRNTDQASVLRQTELDNARNALESAKKKAEDNLTAAARRVEDAEAGVESAQRDYSRNDRQAAESAISNAVSAVSLRLDIDDKKAAVDALNLLMVSEGILYTDISGVVLTVKPAGSVTGKDAVASFMDGAKGFEASMLLDKTEADKLAVGDECEVTTGGGSMYYTPTVTGVVSAIAPPDEQDKVRATIRLPEADWSGGQRVDVRIVRDRSVYDMCVPLAAVRSDNSGYYLLTVELRSSVLGVEYVITMIPVNVNASDDEMAAVRGPVDRNSRIVTASSKAVRAGDRVRVG